MARQNPLDISDDLRAYLLALDDALQAKILSAYQKAIKALEQKIAEMAKIAAVAQESGISPGSIFNEQRRLQELLDDIKAVVDKLNRAALEETIAGKQSASRAALAQIKALETGELFRKSLASFPVGAVSELAVIDSELLKLPISRLFRNIGRIAAESVKDSLIQNVSIGADENQITQAIKSVINVTAARARTIARTETLQAYRESARKEFAGDARFPRWVWISARDRRTCVICWSLHGKTFPSDSKQISHPNCRCTLIPLRRGETIEKLGLTLGEAEFAALPEDVQTDILGKGRFEAYQNGVQLSEMFRYVKQDWGRQPVIVPLNRL